MNNSLNGISIIITIKLILLILISSLLTSCDLMHLDQKIYCAKANQQQCEARPDWCNSGGGKAVCSGGQNCGFCEIGKEALKCVIRSQTKYKCEQAGLLKDGFIRIENEPAWKYNTLSPTTKKFIGEKLTQAAVETMDSHDRKKICEVFPGEPCNLNWDQTTQKAICLLEEEKCQSCKIETPKFICSAKNLCNGVICP